MSNLTKAGNTAVYSDEHILNRLDDVYQAIENGKASMSSFTELVNEIDWENASPEVFLKAIDYAFTLEASKLTHQLSELGHKLYPNHKELAKLAVLFAPPRILRTDLPPQPELAASMQWIEKQSHHYRNTWVAVLGGELVGRDATRKSLIEKLGDLASDPSLLVTRIP